MIKTLPTGKFALPFQKPCDTIIGKKGVARGKKRRGSGVIPARERPLLP